MRMLCNAERPAELGVPYNVSGMLTFLNSASLRLIKEMALTAKPIPADRALHAGLVNHLMPEADLEPFTYALAIVDNAPLSIAVVKEELRVLAGAHLMSPQGWERVQGLRRVIYDSADYVEGLRASATPCASAAPTPPMSAGRSCALP
jgi:methylmalonyl-CoA decarboxylase